MALAAVIVVAATVAGCGEDNEAGGNESASTSSLTKAEYVKKANQICLEGDAQSFEKLETIQGSNITESERAVIANRGILIPEIQGQIDEIQDLGAPEGDEGEAKALLAAMQEGVDNAKRQRRLRSTKQLAEEFKEFDKLAREYGLDSCVFNF